MYIELLPFNNYLNSNKNEEGYAASKLDQKITVPTLLQRAYKYYISDLDKELSDYLTNLSEKAGVPFRKGKSIENVNLINTQAHLQELYYV